MSKLTMTAILGAAALMFTGVGTAEAHGPGRRYAGYGNGLHDYLPHWHRTDTPFGSAYWYGNGPHDFLPHHHSVSPWSGVRSHSFTPFGPTRSYNGFPYSGGYAPYSGGYVPYLGGYYGGGYVPYPGGAYGGYVPYGAGWGW
jgi:hypothetical protein